MIEHVLHLFEKFQTTSEDFLDVLLSKCSEYKAKKLNEQNPEYYQRMNKLFQNIVKRNDVNYYYFDYDDLILIFSKVIQYFTQFWKYYIENYQNLIFLKMENVFF